MCCVALPCLFVCFTLLASFFLPSHLSFKYMHIENYSYTLHKVVSSYKESCNNKPMYGYMLPNLSPSPNLYKVQSVYNNNVAS